MKLGDGCEAPPRNSGHVWWGVEGRDNGTFRPFCPPCISLQILGNNQAPVSHALPSSHLPLCWEVAASYPLESGPYNCKVEVCAHADVSEGLPIGVKRQTQGKQQEVAAGVADSTFPPPSLSGAPNFQLLLPSRCCAWPGLPPHRHLRQNPAINMLLVS